MEVRINKLSSIHGLITIREISRITGWSDAYIRDLNTEIRRAGYWLIGTHNGLFLSTSLADLHYQVNKMNGQAGDMMITADAMNSGQRKPIEEMSDDARRLYFMYAHGTLREYEFPELKAFDFIEVRDGKIV